MDIQWDGITLARSCRRLDRNRRVERRSAAIGSRGARLGRLRLGRVEPCWRAGREGGITQAVIRSNRL